jgi:hypothetical protein
MCVCIKSVLDGPCDIHSLLSLFLFQEDISEVPVAEDSQKSEELYKGNKVNYRVRKPV